MKKDYSLRVLQAAYLPVTLRKESDQEVCMFCWKSGCKHKENKANNDSFINLTSTELNYA